MLYIASFPYRLKTGMWRGSLRKKGSVDFSLVITSKSDIEINSTMKKIIKVYAQEEGY